MELQNYRAILVNLPHVVQTQFVKLKKDTRYVHVPQTISEVHPIADQNAL